MSLSLSEVDPLAETEPLPIGSTLYGFTIEAYLGGGTFGHVYRVRETRRGVSRALKVLHPSMDAHRARFVREGRTLAQLGGHPNVVDIVGIIDEPACTALVLEYVNGLTLADLLDAIAFGEVAPLSVEGLRRLGAGILDGMRAAHRRGILHRDLKPENILLASGSGFPVPKVADFGLGKNLSCLIDGDQTNPGPMGSPAYMAPEQWIDASRVGTAADIWSLGVLLYELCTGSPPFAGETSTEIRTKAMRGTYVPVCAVRPGIPAGMIDAIHGSIRLVPEDRINSCDAMFALWNEESAVTEPTEWLPSVSRRPRVPSSMAETLPLDGVAAG